MNEAQKEVIQVAKRFISHEGRFTKDAYALDASGLSCTPKSLSAVKWCVEGAIYASDGVPESQTFIPSLGFAQINFRSVKGWECIHLIERYMEGRERSADGPPHHTPMLRHIIEPLPHREVLRIFDEVLRARP